MRLLRPTAAALATVLNAACSTARPATTAPAPAQPPAQPGAPGAGAAGAGGAAAARRAAPRPYAQVVTRAAVTDTGGISVHRIEDRWLFEVPDSLVGRDFLLVSRIAGVPTGFSGFTSAAKCSTGQRFVTQFVPGMSIANFTPGGTSVWL